MPAEACTKLGANLPPIGRPPAAYLLAPFFDRWPRFAVLACLIVLVALLGLAGEPPPDEHDDTSASQGLPLELLLAEEPGPQASAPAQPAVLP